MPSWKIHNFWATKLGVPFEVSSEVNLMADQHVPKAFSKYKGYPPTYGELEGMGEDFLVAWFLHHFLDWLEDEIPGAGILLCGACGRDHPECFARKNFLEVYIDCFQRSPDSLGALPSEMKNCWKRYPQIFYSIREFVLLNCKGIYKDLGKEEPYEPLLRLVTLKSRGKYNKLEDLPEGPKKGK